MLRRFAESVRIWNKAPGVLPAPGATAIAVAVLGIGSVLSVLLLSERWQWVPLLVTFAVAVAVVGRSQVSRLRRKEAEASKQGILPALRLILLFVFIGLGEPIFAAVGLKDAGWFGLQLALYLALTDVVTRLAERKRPTTDVADTGMWQR